MCLFLPCLTKEVWFPSLLNPTYRGWALLEKSPTVLSLDKAITKSKCQHVGGTEVCWCPLHWAPGNAAQRCSSPTASNGPHVLPPLPEDHRTTRLQGTGFWEQAYRKPRQKGCTREKPGDLTLVTRVHCRSTLEKYRDRNESSNSPPTWVWSPLWKGGSHCGLSGPQDVPCDCKTARTAPPATTQTTQWGCPNRSEPGLLQKQASISIPASQSHLPSSLLPSWHKGGG